MTITSTVGRSLALAGTVTALSLLLLEPASAQKSQRFPLELKNSEISIDGDNSFVTGRYYWKPYPRDHIWMETLTIRGGFITLFELTPGYYYPWDGITRERQLIVAHFNGTPAVKSKNLTATIDDVKKSSNRYGDYFYVVLGNENHTCAASRQFFGDGNPDGGGSSRGDKTNISGICWRASFGDVSKLEKFLLNFLNVVRFDEGAINKQRIAGGYKSPAAPAAAPAVTTQSSPPADPARGNSELKAKLQALKELEADGLITKDEADAKRKALLKDL